MLKVLSMNVNGIRSAARKGFFDWLLQEQPDVICVQETKAQEHQLSDALFHLTGYHRYFHDAKKPGYSGVGIWTKYLPDRVIRGLGWPEADNEGRYLQLDYREVSIASVYFPSGTSGEVRQGVKFDFLKRFSVHLEQTHAAQKKMIFCGDVNIAHRPIDLKNWRANQKNSGFLPEERAWLDELFSQHGFVDCFREKHPEAIEYSWWSNRGQAWAKNVGWRIDYHIVSPCLKGEILSAHIHKEPRFSDHAAVVGIYSLSLS